MNSSLHMRLLGGFTLEVDGVPVAVASPRLRSLLAFLALHRDAPTPRRRLAFLLWPDTSDSQAQTNLRTLLHRFHTALPAVANALTLDHQYIGWHPHTALRVDVALFEAQLRAADTVASTGDSVAAIEVFEQALGLYSGDLLPDSSDEWFLPERARLHERYLTALNRLVTLLEEQRAYDRALEWGRRLANRDQLNEAATVTLMRLYALAGNRASALRTYHAVVAHLRDELGIEPGAELQALYTKVLAAETELQPAAQTAVPLVGRGAEWHRMLAVWEAAASVPRLLVLSGEAGVGKTRLADELVRRVVRLGGVTATASCYAAAGELAFAPVVTWLRSRAVCAGLLQLDPLWLGEVARLLPELALARPEIRRSTPVAERLQRRQLFEALARAVLAVNCPLLLVLDDLQWCDRDTLDWLHYLLRFEPTPQLLVVATVRVEEVDTSAEALELLEVLRHTGRMVQIELGPLGAAETAELATHVAGTALSAAACARVYAETEGNPLFVVEMLRAGGSVAALAQSDERTRLPDAIRAVLTRRLMHVSPLARDLLRVAAVIGRSFTTAVLARAAEVDDEALVRGLDELWQRRIVRETSGDSYDFSHDKLRAAAYAGLSPAMRRMLHRRVADALASENQATLDDVSGRIAVHYEHAGMPERAAYFFGRAAGAARRLYANQDALEHLLRALALLPAGAKADAAALNEQFGDLLHHLGRYEEARTAWRTAYANTDNYLAAAHIQRKIGNAFRDEGRHDEALSAFGSAEEGLSIQQSSSVQAWQAWIDVQCDRALVYYWLGDAPAIGATIAGMQSAIAAHGTVLQRTRIHQITTMFSWRQTRYTSADALPHIRAYLAALREAEFVDMLPAAQFQLGFSLLWAGELVEAAQAIAAALALAGHSGDVLLEARCLTYLTIIERKHGNLSRVRELAERSLVIAEAGHMHDYIGAAYGNLAWLAWREGDFSGVAEFGGQALGAWAQLVADYPFVWVARWPLLGAALLEGTIAALAEHIRALLDERQQRPPPAIEPVLLAALKAAETGAIEEARAHVEAVFVPARELGYL